MNLDAIQSHRFESVEVEYSDRDTMLYALGIGAFSDSANLGELSFVYEKHLKCLPSMAVVLAHPGMWLAKPELEVQVVKLLHGEQRMELHKPLPATGRVRAEYRVAAVQDKGADKGALMYFDKLLYCASSGDLLCTVSAVYFLRGDGGCGSFGEVPPALAAVPERAPDFVDEFRVDSRAALLYRLSGDRNPIHSDPVIAQKAGFPKPIVQGLLTYGACGLSVLRKVLDYDVNRISSQALRFSSVVFPGEDLKVEGWYVDGGVAFRALAPAREKIVVDNGFIGVR